MDSRFTIEWLKSKILSDPDIPQEAGNMHSLAVKEIAELCERRLSQGDCPIEASPPREVLEDVVIALWRSCTNMKEAIGKALAIAVSIDGDEMTVVEILQTALREAV